MEIIFYRIRRLRRVLFLTTFLIVAGFLTGRALAPADLPGFIALWCLLLAASAAFACLAILVTWPKSWMDALSLSVSSGGFLLISPWFLLHFASDIYDNGTAAFVLQFLLYSALIASLLLFLSTKVSGFYSWLDQFPAGGALLKAEIIYPVSAEQAWAALAYSPGTKVGRRVCSEAGEDGFFTVVSTDRIVNIETWEETDFVHEYQASILEESDFRQVVMYRLDQNDRVSTSVRVLECTDTSRGCLVRTTEQQDHLSLLSRPGYWLNDVGVDYLIADLDAAARVPPRANRDATAHTLFTALAKYMQSRAKPKPEA